MLPRIIQLKCIGQTNSRSPFIGGEFWRIGEEFRGLG